MSNGDQKQRRRSEDYFYPSRDLSDDGRKARAERAARRRVAQIEDAPRAMSDYRAAELRAAEQRIAQLEAEIQQARVRAQRAEQWLHKIVAEIQQRFGNSGNRDERSRQTSSHDYAPKRHMYEGLATEMGDLLHSQTTRSA